MTLQVLALVLSRPADWVLAKETPSLLEIDDPANWAVVNPRDQPLETDTLHLHVEGGLIFTTTHCISFLVPARSSDDITLASNFLRRLRYHTGQATLPTEVAGVAYLEISAPLPRRDLDSPTKRIIKLQEYRERTAITAESLRLAGADSTNRDWPFYGQVLLDAIQACLERDHLKTILYSAIAMEAMAATILHEHYSRFMQSGEAQPQLRITTTVVDRSRTIRRDAVYEALHERDDFKYKLNQLPLYLLGRSLLQEDKGLYDRALLLYRTRNRLVHITVEQDPPPISVSLTGALEALAVARDVFHWFGAPGRYEIPTTFASNT